jgi:predicted TIM-barrel fold metal-dependent hydrolase
MAVNYQVIDADQHVNPPFDFWQTYLPKELRDGAPKLESTKEGDFILFEGGRKPFSMMGSQAGKKGEDYKQSGKKSDTRPGGWDPTARLEDMAIDGIDAAVIYGGGPLASRNFDLHMASFDAYNRWLSDFCRDSPQRLLGIGYTPMFEVETSVENLKRLKKQGMRGVLIPPFPQTHGQSNSGPGAELGMGQVFTVTGDPMGPRTYADPEFDLFWKTCVDLALPVHMHLGARQSRVTEPKKVLADFTMAKVAMAEPVAQLVFGGVFMRHPELKYVTVESGVGWFAFVAYYMDKIWHKHRHWTKNELVEPPSFYMARQVYGTFLDDAVGVETRHFAGAGNIMWSSDYPHSETTWPESRAVIEKNFKGVPEADKYRMLAGIAKELYQL